MAHTSKVTRRGQVTIPQEMREILNLKEGSVVLFELIGKRMEVVPATLIPTDQAWFWTKEHQKNEHEASADLSHGNYEEFASADALIQDLKRASKRKKSS